MLARPKLKRQLRRQLMFVATLPKVTVSTQPAHFGDEVQLLHVVLARKERLAPQQLSHDARHRPAGERRQFEHEDEGTLQQLELFSVASVEWRLPAELSQALLQAQLRKPSTPACNSCTGSTRQQIVAAHGAHPACCMPSLLHSPHVNGCSIVVARQQQLRCAVPACYNILGHCCLLINVPVAWAAARVCKAANRPVRSAELTSALLTTQLVLSKGALCFAVIE